jgi:hypothetical protein
VTSAGPKVLVCFCHPTTGIVAVPPAYMAANT